MSRETRTGGRNATSAKIEGIAALSIGRTAMPASPGSEWRLLTDLARLESGHTPSRARPDYWDGDIPWIGLTDVTSIQGKVIHSTRQTITQAGIDNSSTRLLPEGTVCLSRTASVGFVVSMGRPMATSQDFVNWVCGPELDPSFLRYLLLSEVETIRRIAYGTTHRTMYYPDAKAIHVMVPSLATQQAIAAVLGALDDKIEANSRINSIAQELADSLFASITVATRLETYSNVAEILGGGTPSTKVPEYWGGTIPWATPTDVTALAGPYLTATARKLTESGLANCASALQPEGSILMTSRATIGAFAISKVPTAVNQGFIVVRPHHPDHLLWLYHEMKSRVPDYIANANGATFLELSRGRFKAMELSWPVEESAMGQFVATVQPVHDRAYGALAESERLAELRDTLLPHLMSGQLSVRDAESRVEEVL